MRKNHVAAFMAICCVLSGAGEFQPVNLNVASVEQIMVLPGVGKKLAERIVAHRQERGSFGSLDDLMFVKGMHRKVLEDIAAKTEFSKPKSKAAPAALKPKPEDEKAKTDASALQKTQMQFEKEPSIREIQQQAIKYALSEPSKAMDWESRARISPALPSLSFSGGRGVDHDSTLRDKEGDASVLSKKSSSDVKLGVKLEWKFADLVFNQNELRVARESFRMAVIRERIISDVTKAFIERKKVKLKLAALEKNMLSERLDLELRVEELEAVIDGLTGGWYSEKLTLL